jgi:hypothetical protein
VLTLFLFFIFCRDLGPDRFRASKDFVARGARANAFFSFLFFVGTLGLIDFGQVKTLSLEERVLYAR